MVDKMYDDSKRTPLSLTARPFQYAMEVKKGPIHVLMPVAKSAPDIAWVDGPNPDAGPFTRAANSNRKETVFLAGFAT
ncbi:hypothetical protein [Hoeflea sp. IMCC20628]|uniref:hypothetical protein n=1 Tax=Hoeflea sp. IMCC20628 TaxID=1620421 RepID=UPI0018CF0746|nr:hypothetical protein [Hoeflea sp. IMCC20628]